MMVIILGFSLTGCSAEKATETTDEVDALEDDWWQNEQTDPHNPDDGHTEGGGEFGEGEGEEEGNFFLGYVEATGDSYSGFSELIFGNDCEWYAELTGIPADPCPECERSVAVSFGTPSVVSDTSCPEDLHPDNFIGLTATIGFGGETAWLQENGEWIEMGFAFSEGEIFGWYIEL